MQKNTLRYSPTCALALTIFMTMPLAAQTIEVGGGLAVCKNIVEQHGGKIRLESELGKGAILFFYAAGLNRQDNSIKRMGKAQV